MRIQQSYNRAIMQNQQIKFKGLGCEAPELLEKVALRNDAQKLTASDALYPIVDRLSENFTKIKEFFSENKLVYANIKKEEKKGSEPKFWVVMMPENAHLKQLNVNGYKKSDMIARSYTWLSADSDVFLENVMKKADQMQNDINNALKTPKLK